MFVAFRRSQCRKGDKEDAGPAMMQIDSGLLEPVGIQEVQSSDQGGQRAASEN